MGADNGAVRWLVTACLELELEAGIGTGGAFNLDVPRFFRRVPSLLREKALLDRCWTLGKPVDPDSVLGVPACLTLDPVFLSKTEPTIAPGAPSLIVIATGVVR